ncbi:hypothetical protein [Hydrogenophaga sp.]|uniref:hypothetical protein n=1 Tax=Hydrogenophaga sp. TaxID=1904254 RepID=UPI002632A877|nr:hypothetical protein [Hydrogenophaga sp.]
MKNLLVAMSRADTLYGTHPVRFAVVHGREVLQLGSGAADELGNQAGGSVRMSLDSPANVSERLRVRALSRRFVPVLVQRHLTDNGTFTERFRSRCRVAWLRQGEAEVDVHAMLEDDAELAHNLLPGSTRPLTHLITADAAVANLVRAATAEPVLVHWWHQGSLRSLGVRGGSVAWQRVQPVGDAADKTDEGVWKPLLDSASANAPAEFNGPHCLVIRLGRGPWAAKGDWASNGSRELVQRIAGLFKGTEPAQILLQPDLFGLAFADRHQSLIVNGHRQRVIAWQAAPVAAAIAGLVGAVLLGTGIWWHAQAEQRAAAQQLGVQDIVAQIKAQDAQRPPAGAVAALRSAAWRETALGVNLRADHFLDELLAQVPPDAQVLQIKIRRDDIGNERMGLSDGQPSASTKTARARAKREPVTQQADAAAANDLQPTSELVNFTPGAPVRRMPQAGEPTFAVDLKISLAGGYSGAKLKAEHMAEQLSRLGRLSDTRLVFQDQGPQAPGANLQTRLTIAAGAF